MKKFPPPLLPLFTAAVSLASLLDATPPPPCCDKFPSSPLSVKNGWNVFTWTDWLYWKANETGLGYALNQEMFDITDENIMGYGEVANPKFDWESGFRIGVGYNIPHDEWDLTSVWTWYDGKGSDSQKSTHEILPTLLPVFIHPNIYNDQSIAACKEASYHATVHLNILDLDLDKQFKVSKWLSVKPHLGLRSAWVHQIHDVSYNQLYDKLGDEVLDNYSTHITNNFWGLGIRGGFGSDFGLKWGLSLVGDFFVSLLYGLFETSYSERFSLTGETKTVIAENNSFHAGRVVTDIDLGIRWTKGFSKERVRVFLQGGWEHHMFFSQNQIIHFVDGQSWGNFVQNQGDLYFQGWTTSLRFFF